MTKENEVGFAEQLAAVDMLSTADDKTICRVILQMEKKESCPVVRAAFQTPDSVRSLFRATGAAMRRTGVAMNSTDIQEALRLLDEMMLELQSSGSFTNEQLEAIEASSRRSAYEKML